MKTDFDILIIGGGLVGASLACALRASGLRLGVIEAVPFAASSQPGYDDRTLALAYGSKRIFETLGVWDGIAPEATRIDRVHISDRGHFGAARLTAAEAGLPALGYVVPSRALGAALMKTLQTSKNIEWLCPAEMQDIHFDAASASVTVWHNDGENDRLNPLSLEGEGGGEGDKLEMIRRFAPHPTLPMNLRPKAASARLPLPRAGEGMREREESARFMASIRGNAIWPCGLSPEGRGISKKGSVKTLTARLVIAADGAHSAVRQAMGIEAQRTEYRQTAIVTTVTASVPHGNTAYERFTDTGPLALLPQRQNDCAVVWSARAEEAKTILGWSDAEFLRQLRERFGDRLGSFTRLGRRASYPLALTRVPEQVRPRLALIGNAAHTVHPVAGQGFNLGLRDVAAIADILTDAQRAGSDIGDLTVLRRYADWRRRDNQVIALFTNGLIRIFSNNIFPLTLLRNAGLLAVDLMPGVKRGFVRVTSGLAGKLPHLARGLPS